jgi:hypothetical protein
MALNMTHKFTKSEVWPVGTEVAPGTAVLSSTDQPGVTITGSGDYVKTETIGAVEVTFPAGGVGLADEDATVAIDGAFRFPVVGASSSTAVNTPVYITSAGALTLTEGSNTLFGKVDRFIGETSATETSVWIAAGIPGPAGPAGE